VDVPEYQGPVPDAQFDGLRLPDAWRAYLQSPSWFHRGWLTEQCFLHLYTPAEVRSELEVWAEGPDSHPGIVIIGNDGARERLALDMRDPDPPVVLVDITSEGWAAAIRQADSAADLIGRVEARTFSFTW
jgi:hypothetical protein